MAASARIVIVVLAGCLLAFAATAQDDQERGAESVPGMGQAPGVDQSASAGQGVIAVLQGLDKVTARISTFEAPVNTPVRFGTLEIIARTCHKRPPEEPPESAAFLEITDIRPDEEPMSLFHGWMFASSPALSALEHPVYDVWVVDCRNDSRSSADSSR